MELMIYNQSVPRPPLLSNIVCYHCDSCETSKSGFTRGKQRYYCRACRRWSRESPIISNGGNNKRQRSKSLPSKSHLVLSLQAIAQRLGRTPTTTDIVELSKARRSYPLQNYYDVFGSFPEAIKKAGLRANYKQAFDKDRLLHELRELHARLKHPLLGKDVIAARKKGKVSSMYHFQRAFGSVPKAIEAASVGKKTYTRAEMIEFLRHLDKTFSRPVLAADISKLFHAGKAPSCRAIEREFGGMSKARRAAGINNLYKTESGATKYWQKYTPEKLIEQLKALREKLGRKPTDRDINQASKEGMCASAITFTRMFGSLLSAYQKAGFEIKTTKL